MTTLQLLRRTTVDALIVSYFVVTSLGVYTTFTHQSPAFLRPLTRFSYGMLAPYQGDSDENYDIAVVAWHQNMSVLHPVHQYVPGIFGEKILRITMVFIPEKDIEGRRKAYTSFFSQILEHERDTGKQIDRFDVYSEVWQRSPLSYYERRPLAKREFLLSVQ